MSERKHYHIHAPYQHPQQQQQQHHHTQQQQQHNQAHQQQWYTHGNLTQQQQQQHYHHGLHIRDSRHIQHHQHQQPHHNHHTMPHMFTSGYVGMSSAVSGGGGGGGSSTHSSTSAAVAQRNMPASSSTSLHYSTTMPSASSGGVVSGGSTSSSSGAVGIVSRNRIFDLEILNTQHGISSSSNSSRSAVSGHGAFDAFSHNSLYSQQTPRHHPHHHPPPPHALHHPPHQPQQQPHPHQQHYYHHQQSLHRPHQQQHHHQQVMPQMLQNIKSEPVEQITITPSIQTEEIIIKSEPMDEVIFHKNAPQIENNPFNMEEKRKQQQLQEQQHHHHHHLHQHHHENVSQQIQRTNLPNSTNIPTTTEEKQTSLNNVKTEQKPLNFPRRKLQTERSSTLPICQRCKQVFLKRQSYIQHVALSSCNIVEYDFKCYICPMSFMSNEELQTHEQLHRMHRYFCQKYCGKFYETIEECEQHEYGQHEYEMYKCNICCISLPQRDQLFNHIAEHRHQPRFDCCICRLCFQTSMELHEHYTTNAEFCGKFYDKQAFKTQQITSTPYLGTPESSHFEIANTFSLKDIPPSKSHDLEPLYAKQQEKPKSSLDSITPSTPTSYSNIPEFALEPQVEVKTEIKVEPDFYPPMEHADYSSYDNNDYAATDYPPSLNENFAFLQDFQDNASNSTNSSYSFNNNEAIQDEAAVCCVPKCGVRKISSPSLQFYSFPRDEKYLSQWLHNLKMSYDPNVNYGIYRICSLHFPKRCIARYSLSYWAVPTFNLGHDDVGNLYQNRESSGGFPAGDVAKCSMPGCPSQRGETNVKFHIFPRDLKTLIKWCQNSRLPVHSKENRFFCSRHFEEKCFGKFRLKPWAIPTLNLGTVYGKIHDNPNIYQEEKKCFLPYCRRSRSYDCNLSLYRFPRDETLLRRWCYNLRLDPEIYRGKNHKICSSHFIKEALGLRKLNPGAVPTLHLGHNDRFNIYENELYTPPPPPSPQPSTSSASAKAQKFAEMFKQEVGGSSHIYDEVFMNSMIQKFSSSSNSNASSTQLDLGDVCLVPSCKRTRHSDEITLHTVPKRPEQLQKWCHNLKMDLVKMHKSVRICSAHFEKYCIGGCMRPFAVPTIELGHDDPNIYRNPDVIKKLNIRETCCIGSCKRNRDRDHANLHRFPTHPELLQKWCENLQKPIPDGTKLFNDAVCEIHFEDRCLRNKRLEKWAIPTLLLGWDEAPHILPSEEEITEYWTKPFAPNNGDEQGDCCVSTCKRNPQIDDVKLYRPPEDPEQMVKWAHNLQVEVTDLPNLKICNLHFEQHCIGKRLLNWAMPTLNLASKVEHLFENPPPAPTIYKKKEKPLRIHSTPDGIKWSPRCSLPHCRKARTLDRVHLFRFPYNNRQTLHKWCHNLQLPLVGSSHRRICSSHFESSVLTKRCPMTLAVPTLDLNAPPGYKIYPNPTRLKQLKVGPQRQCIIENCHKTKLDGVSLFRFPNNRAILHKWRHNIKNWPKGKLSNQLRICSHHFEPHSVGEKKLSPGAIPTINLGHDGKDLYPNETRSYFDLGKCAVSSCVSRKEMEDVRLFRFPRDDDDLLKKWCHNLKMEPNDCVGIRVCSKHFEIECLGPRMLYKWAVPTLKLGHKEDDSLEIIPNPPPEQRSGEFLFKCCIPTCGKTRKYDDAQMNSFPKHLKLFKKWKHNLKLDFLNFKEREKYKICNDHFEPVCVGKTRLNFGALPTLKLGHDEAEDLYKINPERIRPNLFVRQKDIERMERRKILRKENQEYDENMLEQGEDINESLGLEVADIKCFVENCKAPKSIMREPYDLPESKEIRNLWLNVYQKNEDLATETKICGLHFQQLFKQLKTQMLNLVDNNPDLKLDFNKLQYNYQKSNISLVICSYQCRVSECPTNLLNSNIRLFFFPYGKNLISKWSYNTGIIPDEHRRYMNKVCALHFESYCISENQRLRSWAIPTLNLPPLKDEEEIYQNPDLTKIDKRMLGPQILKCAVKNCHSDNKAEEESVKLFNFPSEEDLLKKWCDNLKISHELTPLLKICPLHFEKLCFGSCRIRSWAIPTLNLGHAEEPKHFNKTTIRQEVYEKPDETTEIQLKQVKIKKSLDTTKCYISTCRKSRLQHGVRFYNLPAKNKMKRKWLHNLQITKFKSTQKLQNIKICNLHFHKKCLEGKQLKSWAVPTLHLGHYENIFDNPQKTHGLPAIRCALLHCKNRTSLKEIRCFVFPKSPEFLEKWSKNLKLDLEKCKGRVCIEHFEKDVIGDKKLQNGAVPTLNLDHNDKIYDNKELIEKLKLKQAQKAEIGCKKTKHRQPEEEGEMEVEEYEDCYEEDAEEEEDFDYDEDEVKEEEEEDEISNTTTLSHWSSVINKELRVTLTHLTPEDLYDLCSRSSYEREFGSRTPSCRRSVTPSTSLYDGKSETSDQKSSFKHKSSDNVDQNSDKNCREPHLENIEEMNPDNLFREPKSQTTDQKTHKTFTEPRSITPDKTRLGESRSLTPDQNCFREPRSQTPDQKPNILRESFKNENSQKQGEAISISEQNEEDRCNSSTALRTDKAINSISPICCLKYCGKEKTPEQHLTTYGFPKDPQLLQKWCDNLGLQPEECIGRVCIDHFELRVIGTRRLKLGAVPTLNLGQNRIAKHTNTEETQQKKSVTRESTISGNTQDPDIKLLPPPPYVTPKPAKQSVFRLCCLKHCRRKKEQEAMKWGEKQEKLFKFPKDVIILKKWCKNLRLPEKSCLRPDLEICAKHFDTVAIQGEKLHPKAVPTLQLSYANREPVYKNSPKDFLNESWGIKKQNPENCLEVKTKKHSKSFVASNTDIKDKCFLKHCGKSGDSDDLFLIPFPQYDMSLQRRWCRNLKLTSKFSQHKHLKICSDHFEPYVFYKCRNLKSGAVPTLRLGHSDKIIKNFRRLRLKKVASSKKEKCCIETCQETKLKLYAFPRSCELRRIWCNNLQIEVRKALNNHYKLCAKHFSVESFTVGTENLKLNAVPILNLGLQNQNHIQVTNKLNVTDTLKCLVENCQKTPSVDRVKLYGFPLIKEIFKKWLFNLNITPETVNKDSLICNRHFDKCCIKNGVLHEKAIPTQFLEVSPKGWFYQNNEELFGEPKPICIFQCQESGEKESKHLYKFPKHPEELKKWLFNIKFKIEESELHKSRICALHFEDSCKIPGKELLLPGSLPTLNLGHDNSEGIYQNNFKKCCLETCFLEGFQFHKLPEDLMLQSFWFQELEMETSYNNSLYICSVHYVSLYERVLEKYSAFLKESKEYVKLSFIYQELKALPELQNFKCYIPNCASGFKLIWKLFKFPKDESLFNKWLHNTGLKFEYSQRNTYRICAQHFEERCLSEIKLHRWSLPTLKLPFNNSLYVNPPEALPSNHENLKHCCVSNCHTEKEPFFKFPKQHIEIKKWIHNLELGSQQCTLNLRVCYKHFESYCFTLEDNKIKQLKFWSVPTLRLNRRSDIYLNPSDKMAFFVCCLSSCRQILNKSKHLYLFKFPKSNTLKQKWFNNINLNTQDYKESMRICSSHFEVECFDKTSKLLRKHSVPTLGLPKHKKELFTNPVRRPNARCCVQLCKGPFTDLISFPKDKSLLRKWCHNLQIDIKLKLLRNWKICGKHFHPKCRNNIGLIRSLAVPTLKLGHKSKKIFKNPKFNQQQQAMENEENTKQTSLNKEIQSLENKKAVKEKNQAFNVASISEKPKETTTRKKALKEETTTELTVEEITDNLEISNTEKKFKAVKNVKEPKKVTIEKRSSKLTSFIGNPKDTKDFNKEQEISLNEDNLENNDKEDLYDYLEPLENLPESLIGSCKMNLKDIKEKPNTEVKDDHFQTSTKSPKNYFAQQVTKENSTPQIKTLKEAELTLNKEDLINNEEEDYLQEYMDYIETQESYEDILPECNQDYKKLTGKLTQEKSCLNIKQKQTGSLNVENREGSSHDFDESSRITENTIGIEESDAFTIKQEMLEDSHEENAQHDYQMNQEHEHFLLDAFEERYKNENSHSLGNEELLDVFNKMKHKISCCIKTCPNHITIKEDIQLFKFPTKELRTVWLTNCQIALPFKFKYKLRRLRVCMEHFEKQCFVETRLLFGSIPTLKLGIELKTAQSCKESLNDFLNFRCKVSNCQRSQQFDDIFKMPFPQGDLKTKWCFNLNFKEEEISEIDWICNKHFEKRALITKSKTKHDAVPTLLLGHEALESSDLFQNPEYISPTEYAKRLSQTCCVNSCPNTKQNSSVHFASFAACYKSQDIYEKWLKNLDLQDSPDVRQFYFICLDHFEPICYTTYGGLKYGSIPTLKLDKKQVLFEVDPKTLTTPLKFPRKPKHVSVVKSKWKCKYPQCLEEKITVYKWPNRDIFKTMWLDCIATKTTASNNAEEDLENNDIPLCDEHYYILYKSNKEYMESLFENDETDLNNLFKSLQTVFEDITARKKIISKRCSVPRCCTDHLFDQYKDIRLFGFSKFPDISKKWCYNCDIDFDVINGKIEYKICALHFEPYCFTRNYVFQWAVPTLNLPDTKPKNILKNDPENEFAYSGQCCIKSCTNSKGLDLTTKTRFFRFPENPTMLEKWFCNIDCEQFDINEIRICGLHFQNMYQNQKHLKEYAVPTLKMDKIIKEDFQELQIIEMDENIEVKQELDYSEEWCGEVEEYYNKNLPLKMQTTENLQPPCQQTKYEKIRKETNEFEAIEIKEEIIEIQERDFEYSIKAAQSTKQELQKQTTNKPHFEYLHNKAQTSKQSFQETQHMSENFKITQKFSNQHVSYTAPNFQNSPPLTVKQEISEQESLENIEYFCNSTQSTNQVTIPQQQQDTPHCSYLPQNIENIYNPAQSFNLKITQVKSQILLCCVRNCLNSSETPDTQMYTEFPRDSEIFIKWCFNLKIDPRNYKDQQYAICQQHFESVCFRGNSSLHAWSVPTLYLNLPDNSFIHPNDPPQHLKPSEQCIVYGCINPLQPLYKFPMRQDITLKWFSNLKLDYTDFRAQNYRICKRHFATQSFQDSNKLKIQAIPTLYLGHTDKINYLNPLEEYQDQDSIPPPAGAAVAQGQGNSRGSSQGSLIRPLISPHVLEDNDSSYYEDFEEYYGQDD